MTLGGKSIAYKIICGLLLYECLCISSLKSIVIQLPREKLPSCVLNYRGTVHFCDKHNLDEDYIFFLNLLATGAALSCYPPFFFIIQLLVQKKKCDMRVGSSAPSFGRVGNKSSLKAVFLIRTFSLHV